MSKERTKFSRPRLEILKRAYGYNVGWKNLLIPPRRAYFPRYISNAAKNDNGKSRIFQKDKPKECKLEIHEQRNPSNGVELYLIKGHTQSSRSVYSLWCLVTAYKLWKGMWSALWIIGLQGHSHTGEETIRLLLRSKTLHSTH